MALLRRGKTQAPSAPPEPEAVLLRYAGMRTKRDVDRFLAVAAVLQARLPDAAVAADRDDEVGTITATGPDSRVIWAAAEPAVRLCPLLPHGVELHGAGAATARLTDLEPAGPRLRDRLVLSLPDGSVVRRATAFDLLVALSCLEDGQRVGLSEGASGVACWLQDDEWLVESPEHVLVTGADEAFDLMAGWGSAEP